MFLSLSLPGWHYIVQAAIVRSMAVDGGPSLTRRRAKREQEEGGGEREGEGEGEGGRGATMARKSALAAVLAMQPLAQPFR